MADGVRPASFPMFRSGFSVSSGVCPRRAGQEVSLLVSSTTGAAGLMMAVLAETTAFPRRPSRPQARPRWTKWNARMG